jgi:acetyl esterase/lipase
MSATHPPVPFEREIEPIVAVMAPMFAQGDPGAIPGRGGSMPMSTPHDAVAGRQIDVEEVRIPGYEGALLEATIFRSQRARGPVPGLFNIHGGGMVSGHRYMDNERLVELVDEFALVAVNIEYRLAPEYPFPFGVEDCYAGLAWTAENAAEIGIKPDRTIVMGGSAGGGLSAAVALMARDRGGPALAGQMLLCPMVDDTNTSVSFHQYPEHATWPGNTNVRAWQLLLGDAYGSDTVSPYAAPLRAPDLANLAPALIEAGAAEVFRDENVAYATRIWQAGGDAELHIWAGACHGFDIFAPAAEVSRAALATRSSWLRRVLDL